MAPRKKFYVVWNGYATGVFDSWDECQLQIKGYPDAKFKSFDSQEAAVEAYRGDPADQMDILKAIAEGPKTEVNYAAFPEIRLDAPAALPSPKIPARWNIRAYGCARAKESFMQGHSKGAPTT